ncbi:MFS transporter [Leuconostoc pseudomesenteroides]|uniref:MFS transporter n=1 Tax=Leuconostoc falkenbergense TaxID=2766470 RepID=UPI000E0954C5|nr:MFS transporter [Leuconostoc falkenbergense]MCT4410887.1 MFS transporter [Leuconostoc falkenbergense]RDG17646.1 MFS transporter [Leuconostoc pseudomesenteroides]
MNSVYSVNTICYDFIHKLSETDVVALRIKGQDQMKNNEKPIALLMGLSLFMEMLDSTIVTTALPQIQNSLQITAANASLIISVYMIAVAIFIPLSGWLAKKYGNKTIWLLAIIMFTVSSVGSGLASNLTLMLSMRLLQGFSGALLVPIARLIVLENTPPQNLLKMISFVIWPALIAPAIAPFIGGVLSTYWSWRLIFMINVPIGMALFIIGNNVLQHDIKRTDKSTSFDWIGFALISLASASLLIALDIISSKKVLNMLSIVLLLIFISSTIGTVKHLIKATSPLFSIRALRFPSYKVSQFGGSIMWLTVGAIPYLSTIFFQNAFHWSAIKTGSFVLFIFVGNIAIKPFANNIIQKLGFKNTIIVSLFLIFITTIMIGTLTSQINQFYIIAILTLSGVGRSLALTAYNGMSLVEIPYDERNSANTLAAVSQNLSQGIGISLVTISYSVLNQYLTDLNAYRLTYILLEIFIIVPIIEAMIQPRSIGVVKQSDLS